MMKYLQKLGKSLMLPVAVLPICGLLMGIGYALCPSTMQGGDVVGLAQIIGFLLVKAGGASSALPSAWPTNPTEPPLWPAWLPG